MVLPRVRHFGVILRSAPDLEQLWSDLAATELDIELEALSTDSNGEGSFRFRYLLPMAVESQFTPRCCAAS